MLDAFVKLFSWKVWLCIAIGCIVVLWLCFGGKHEYEVDYPWNNSPPHNHNPPPSYRQPALYDNPPPSYRQPALYDNPPPSYRQPELQPIPLYDVVSPRAQLVPFPEYVNDPQLHPFHPAEMVIDVQPDIQPGMNPQFVPDWNTGSSVGEALTCGAMEELLGRPISRDIGLPEMVNPRTGRRMRLDCYDPVTGLTGEYNGKQHYGYPNVFHKSEEEFTQQLYRDQTKRELCDSTGKYLIPVPYTVDMCTPDPSKQSGLNCKTSVPRHERQRRIREYMKQQFDIYYTAVGNEGLP
jgi:hypothetical protein